MEPNPIAALPHLPSSQISKNKTLRTETSRRRIYSDWIKRIFDCSVALVGLILLAPVFGLIAIAIRRDSQGAVFFRGPRVGLNGELFQILKFRTMYESPESYFGPRVTARDDPRVTRVGRWLRDTKLNELPQLWNVLKGEMSLVGPRPEDPEITKSWPPEVQQEILSVRPGITSPASVEYRHEEDLLHTRDVMHEYFERFSPDKLRLDQLYVRYRSFWLDLDVLFWTMLVLLPKLYTYSPPEQLIFIGPITRLIRRHISWFTIDLLITFISIGFTGLVWHAFGPLMVGWVEAVYMAVGFALLFSLSGALFGVNRIKWSQATDADAFDLLPGWVLATAVAYFVNLFMGFFPSELILAAAVLSLIFFIVVRYQRRLVTGFFERILPKLARSQAARERVLIVGSGPLAQLTAWLLSHPNISRRFKLVGFVDDDLRKQETRIYGATVVGTCKDIPKLIRKLDVGVVILADEISSVRDIRWILDSSGPFPARLVIVPDILTGFTEIIAGSSEKVSDLAGDSCNYCLTRLASQPQWRSDESLEG